MNLKALIRRLFYIIIPLYQHLYIKRIQSKKTINVVLFAMNLSMWKCESLYHLLSKNSRFKVTVIVIPCTDYDLKQQKKDCENLCLHFEKNNIDYHLGINENGNYYNIRKKINPDIIFYPQPYKTYIPTKFYYTRFLDKLLCYYPYAFWTSKGVWSYDQAYHNIAWKLFYSTELHKIDAQKYASNKGKNVEIVGYPNADLFLNQNHLNIWKVQSNRKKRIIWAPHFTIFSGGSLYQSNFLWMANFMLELARSYSDKIQFAFKPHPRLYTELCKHKDWGNEITNAYYQQWETMENTQLESGEYIDLFMTSDAMIHDSSSFTVEYHYSQKPVMFITNNYEEHLEGKSEFGKLAMEQHYIGKDQEDIIQFIENVVLKGNDPMKAGREDFFKQYLLPPNGKTVAQNTMDVFIKAFC